MADPNEIAGWTIAGVAGSGGVLWLLRWVIRTFHIDVLAIKASNAEVNVITRLESEIARLEAIIHGQAVTIAAMQLQINGIQELEVQDAADLATLAALIDVNCGECPHANEAKKRMADVVRDMFRRRGVKQ